MPPPRGSMRITSAPNCAIVMPPSGAATKAENSTIRRSASRLFMAPPVKPRWGDASSGGAGDERAHRMRFVLDLVEPALDQIADADDAAQPAVAHHWKVADAPVGHLGHQLRDAVVGAAGHGRLCHHIA